MAREETFGPVAPLFRFKTEEDVIAMANDTPFGLAAYFYARDVGRVWRVAEALECGIIGINEGIISNEVAPFGGFKQIRPRPRGLPPRRRGVPGDQVPADGRAVRKSSLSPRLTDLSLARTGRGEGMRVGGGHEIRRRWWRTGSSRPPSGPWHRRGRHDARPRHRLDGGQVRRPGGTARQGRPEGQVRADLGGDARAGRAARHSADHARRDAVPRPHGRRRRRDRRPAAPHQGRRRRAAAREDRGHRLASAWSSSPMPPSSWPRSASSRSPSRWSASGSPPRATWSRCWPPTPAARATSSCGLGADGQPFVTDSGNVILDCAFGPIADPEALDEALKLRPRRGRERPVPRHRRCGHHRRPRRRRRARARHRHQTRAEPRQPRQQEGDQPMPYRALASSWRPCSRSSLVPTPVARPGARSRPARSGQGDDGDRASTSSSSR